MKGSPLGLKLFVGVVVAVVVAAVGVGIFFSGSPGGQRLVRFDERRVSDLQDISVAINRYWENNEQLPESLENLKVPEYFVRSVRDPATEEPYEYGVLEPSLYQLCAVFQTDVSARRRDFDTPFSQQVWDHGVGRTCFDLEPQSSDHRLPREVPRPTPPVRSR
ncbi:MAG: hypothetical protein ACE5Q6_05570 [Dehalococcoidia bacterium]